MRFKKQNYFVKLLIYFVLLTILPTSVIFGYTTFKNNQSIKSLLLDTSKKVLSNTIVSFENNMQQVFDNIILFICQQDTYIFLNNVDFKALESNNGPFDESELKLLPQYVYSKKYFFLTLEGFQKSYSFINAVYVYDSRSDIVYSSDGSISESDKYYDNSWHSYLDDTDIFPIIIDKRIKNRSEGSTENIDVMTVIYKSGSVFFVVNIEYELLFESSISHLADINKSRSNYIVINNDNKVLINRSESADFDMLTLQDMISRTSEDKLIGIKDKNDDDFFAVYLSSSLLNWTFIELIPVSAISTEVSRIYYITLLIFLILIVFLIFASLFFSKRAYRPIRGIIDLTSSIGLRNKNEEMNQTDIEIIHENILKLSTEKNNLKKTFEELLPALKDKFYYDLLTGHVSDKKAVDDMLDHLGMNLPFNDYYAVIIDINVLIKRMRGFPETEIKAFARHISNKLNSLFEKKAVGFFVELQENEIGIAFNRKKEELQSLISLINEFNEEINLHNDLSISTGIGEHVSDIMHIKESVEQARAANKYKLTFGENQVICYSEIKDIAEEKTGDSSLADMTERFSNFLSTGLKDKAESELMNVIDCLSARRLEISFKSATDVYFTLMNEIYAISARKKESIDIISLLDKNVITKASKHEIYLFFSNIINAFCENQKSVFYKSKIDKTLESICEYIAENYAKDISLDEIAEKAGFNSAYLCRIFKENTGTNLVRFIEKIRIDKAKEMLMSTDVKIFEICCRVGYMNPNYFAKVFKKHTGLTPVEFRQNNAG